jgi:hypothetical protein
MPCRYPSRQPPRRAMVRRSKRLSSSISRKTCRCCSAHPDRIPRLLLCSHYIDLSMTSHLVLVMVRMRRPVECRVQIRLGTTPIDPQLPIHSASSDQLLPMTVKNPIATWNPLAHSPATNPDLICQLRSIVRSWHPYSNLSTFTIC